MSCCEGILQEPKGERTEIIRPEGGVNNGSPETVDMFLYEWMFGHAPLIFSTFPAIALRLQRFDEKALKTSLAKVMQAIPTIAGRFRDNGRTLVLNGAGVPFKVVESSEASAPEIIQEKTLLKYADFNRPASVRRGRCSVMTIKLTAFKDGSAVLCMCRSHMLFDGTSAWVFLNYWASLARGEAPPLPPWKKDQVQALMPDEEATQKLAEEIIGRRIKYSVLVPVINLVTDVMTPVVDTLFFHAGVGSERQRVFFSDQEVASIKAAATPANGNSNNWVSTQEALAAFLLQSLAKILLPPTSKGLGLVTFLLDPRKHVKLPADQLLGCGLTMVTLEVESVLTSTMPEIARKIHEGMQNGDGSPDKLNKKWRLLFGSCQKQMHFDVFQEDNKTGDIMLQLNNASKRTLPDFGSGRAQSVITNAGPTLMLPCKGGLEVHLDNSVFRSTRCYGVPAQRKAAEALRGYLPKSV